MTVQDVMTRKVLTIRVDDSVALARRRMTDAKVQQLVVRDRRGRVLGVISAGDARDAPDAGAVGDFMCRKLLVVHPDVSLGDAAALMRAHAIGSLPVLRAQQLVGIVTVSDLLDTLRTLDRPAILDNVAKADGRSLDRIASRVRSRRPAAQTL